MPDTLPDSLAAGANCRFSQVYYGLDRLAPAPGETLLIQGAGSMGLYAAAIARELGVVTIVIDSVAERLEMAKRFGADHLINMTEYPTLSDREQAVRDLTGGRGADMALEVTGRGLRSGRGAPSPGPHGPLRDHRHQRPLGAGNAFSRIHYPQEPDGHRRGRYLPEYLYKSLVFLDRFQNKYPFDAFSSQSFSLDQLEDGLQMVADRKVIRAVVQPEA